MRRHKRAVDEDVSLPVDCTEVQHQLLAIGQDGRDHAATIPDRLEITLVCNQAGRRFGREGHHDLTGELDLLKTKHCLVVDGEVPLAVEVGPLGALHERPGIAVKL
ncbi:MAG: hypothetical protein WC714_14340 [Candidatus Obscuribacterales bacterium]